MQGLTIAMGSALALGLHKAWSLENRYFFVIVIGAVLLSASMLFLRRFTDFLFVAFLCAVPVTAFVRTVFFKELGYDENIAGILIYSGVIGIGPVDILLWGLYALWFIRVFVTRQAPVPLPQGPDALILLLMLAYLLSMPGVPDPHAAAFALAYLLRFVMVYFYVSRNFEARHIRWALLVIALIVLSESMLAGYQVVTGKLIGLAMDRGAGVRIDQQYTVPGIEHRNRATGTACESHTFGLFMSMLAQYAFATMCWCFHYRRYRLVSAVVQALAVLAVLVSFSRSAWICCAIGLLLIWFVHLFVWKEREILLVSLIVGAVGLFFAPWGLQIIIERFRTSGGLLSARFAQYPVAWSVWRDHFFCGFGVGNYMEALKTYNQRGAANLPVHNAFLWLGAETGVVGVTAFFGMLFGAMRRSWRLVNRAHDLYSRVGLAILAALLVYFFDGLTDPLYREPTVFMTLWVTIGVSVALMRLYREDRLREVMLANASVEPTERAGS